MGMHTKAAIIEVVSKVPSHLNSCSRNWCSRDMVASHAEDGYEKQMQKHSFCTPSTNHPSPQNPLQSEFFSIHHSKFCQASRTYKNAGKM